ncbi:hypothetical protein EVC45_05135 [Paraburkholderia sp. UYCP14C]|uniref:hypothetical protein n=1 Tax=Paraburkholderia sp. UYCP14C TaxID=2511130 RepID=UPI0010224C93|nr:hypothetical protein [Paraburkholderia sp. UYCP14C]RZF30848.1 hypothetical protein EVC45_05135 [Paraburkholderia sp. UYCP14C]
MGKSKKVGKMRFYPMLAARLEFARSDEILETTLQHDTPIPAPPTRTIPLAALRDPRPHDPASTLHDN